MSKIVLYAKRVKRLRYYFVRLRYSFAVISLPDNKTFDYSQLTAGTAS